MPDALSSSVPLLAAAPGLAEYEQFEIFPVPSNSGAIRAYRGYIRPFSGDENARSILRAIRKNLPLNVWGGRLFADASGIGKHFLEDYLVNMAVPCAILVLEFPGNEHPRAFLLSPEMEPRFTWSPHLRTDKGIEFNGRTFPALCVYSGNLIRYAADRSRLAQFLDQTATYLAKYLIWLRTRQLHRLENGRKRLVRERRPDEAVERTALSHSPNLFWDGYWPGGSAPCGPAAHLATIAPDHECWCWSGEKYGECCRPRELNDIEQIKRELAAAYLVPRLMSAVKSK